MFSMRENIFKSRAIILSFIQCKMFSRLYRVGPLALIRSTVHLTSANIHMVGVAYLVNVSKHNIAEVFRFEIIRQFL